MVSMVLPMSTECHIPPPFGTSVCQTHTGAICGQYTLVSITFSHGPDEAMSTWTWQKLVSELFDSILLKINLGYTY